MTNNALAAALLLLHAGAWAAPAPAAPKASDGLVMSVMTSTQLNFGRLSIGGLATDDGAYLDEKEVRQVGLHSRLAIAVEKDPSMYREIDLRVGQTVEVAGYRIKVESIAPGGRGSTVLRLWAPPEPVKPAKKWPFSWFNFGRN